LASQLEEAKKESTGKDKVVEETKEQCKQKVKDALIKFAESKKKFEDAESKEHLAILTSRAFKNAKQVAENAARGSFPSSKPVKLPHYDFEDIYTRLRVHYKTLKPR
jgi:hypothetical protein